MKTFILRLLFIMTVLLFGILFGIYQSHHGPFAPQQQVKQVEKVENEEIVKEEKNAKRPKKEANVTKIENVESERETELMMKQEKAQAVSAVNFYSELGTKIGDIFQHIFSSLVSALFDSIHSFLNGK